MTTQVYIVIATSAGTINGRAVTAGEIVDRILWDGEAAITLPTNTEARVDPNGTLQIGSTTTV